MLRLTLYSKSNCLLCEEAKQAIAEFQQECELTLDVVDISKDAKLWDKYQFDIPVLFVKGQEAARHHIGVKKLRVLHKRWKEGQGFAAPHAGVFPPA